MSIYQKLLDELADSKAPLTDILLKLKILASKLKNKKLKTLVECELTGYNNNIPNYRRHSGVLTGTIESMRDIRKSVTLPTSHLDKKIVDKLTDISFPQNIAELTELLKQDNLCKPIPTEFYAFLSEGLSDFYVVTRAYVPILKSYISGILTSIRSNLLDLILAMENELNETELENLFKMPTQEQQNKANKVINNYIQNNFNSYNDSTQNTKIELGTGKWHKEH